MIFKTLVLRPWSFFLSKNDPKRPRSTYFKKRIFHQVLILNFFKFSIVFLKQKRRQQMKIHWFRTKSMACRDFRNVEHWRTR